MILKNIADCQSREKRGEKSKDGIKRVSKGDRAQKAYKKKRLIIVSKKITKQQLGNQFANALAKLRLIKLIGENIPYELNNARKEQIGFQGNNTVAPVYQQEQKSLSKAEQFFPQKYGACRY